MMLWLLIAIPMAAGLFCLADRGGRTFCRWLALAAMAADLVIGIVLWVQHAADSAAWWEVFDKPWIPQVGSRFLLGLDGLALVMVLLTAVVGMGAVLASWRQVTQRAGLFHFNLLWMLAGVMGIFLALDMLLFYAFWEVMLIPLYFLIALWGSGRRRAAAIKMFLFTQISGLLMLLAILGLYFEHGRQSGDYTFSYFALQNTTLGPAAAFVLMLGFFAAFAVKLPAVPLHTWLVDAHEETPISGGVDLAGLLIKIGAYGLLRFVLGLFPQAASGGFATFAMILGVVGIFYCGLMAFAQKDLKRMAAYISVSHMGFALVGIFAGTPLALQGVVLLIIAGGISTGALFVLVGVVHDRTGRRDLAHLGGLWNSLPRTGGAAMFFALAAMGLPATVNFLGELLVLAGVMQVSVTFAALVAGGFIVSVIYALWFMHRVFQGPEPVEGQGPEPVQGQPSLVLAGKRDLGPREWMILAPAMGIVLWLGLWPRPILSASETATEDIARHSITQPPEVNQVPAATEGER